MSKNTKIVLYVLLVAVLIAVAVIVYNYSTGGTLFQGALRSFDSPVITNQYDLNDSQPSKGDLPGSSGTPSESYDAMMDIPGGTYDAETTELDYEANTTEEAVDINSQVDENEAVDINSQVNANEAEENTDIPLNVNASESEEASEQDNPFAP